MNFLQNFDNPNAQLILTIALIYIILLWVSVLVWAGRDIFQRSNSIVFQTFAILLNLIPPPLGVILYLIIRPNKTLNERYYEEALIELSHQYYCEKKQTTKKTTQKETKQEKKSNA